MITITRRSRIFFALFLAGSVVCRGACAAEESSRLKVAVTIAPLAAFVEGVTKDTADITVMVPPGADPHTYEPTPSQLMGLSDADVYVKLGSGLDFEQTWMKKFRALNKKMIICDSGEGITLLDAQEHGVSGHRHGGKDPHIWLSPSNAIIMVRNTEKVLSSAEPDNSDFYGVNARNYITELSLLDRDLRRQLEAVRGKAFFVFHPAWGYFASDYGLKEETIQAGGKEPTARQLADLVRKGKERGVKTIFISPQFSKKSTEVIAREIGANVVEVDPLSEDYIPNIRHVAEELARSAE